LDRVEQQGYVERVRSENDRRLSIARITSQGLLVIDEITPCFESIWQELSSKISRAESMMLSEICEKIYVGGYCKEVRIDM
jgi:DNA-binding MarR family transcriptional regulator